MRNEDGFGIFLIVLVLAIIVIVALHLLGVHPGV